MKQRPRISAVLNTYNAAEHLEQVMQSLDAFDEIVVVDMHSTDATRQIAARHGAVIVDHEHCGICEPARNAAIQAASSEWVLIVDADELVPVTLREHLYRVAASADAPAALRIPRRNRFMGREMRCLYPDYVTRFGRRDLIDWPPTIHSQPVVSGPVADIPPRRRDLALVHLEENTLQSRREKMERYAQKELLRRGPHRYGAAAMLLKSAARFMHFYIFKQGWRDGRAGWMWARLEAAYKRAVLRAQNAAAKNVES